MSDAVLYAAGIATGATIVLVVQLLFAARLPRIPSTRAQLRADRKNRRLNVRLVSTDQLDADTTRPMRKEVSGGDD